LRPTTKSDNYGNNNTSQYQYAPLPQQESKTSSLTMLHTSIDAGFDEACTIGHDDDYYLDHNNDQSWACSFGTEEGVRG
jgi:hypothetical protein